MTIRTFTAIAAALLATSASAATFTGTFAHDDAKAALYFYAKTATSVTLTSTGYAAGGFDPILSLYDSSGALVDFNDDQAANNPDSKLVETLAAGRYTAFVTQYDNFGPASLGLPFNFDGQPNFRGGFVDFYGNQRTGFWSVDVDGAAKAGVVPEAATWAMLVVGFGVVGAAMRRRTSTVVAA